MRVAAGLGCRRGVPARAVRDLLEQAAARAGVAPTLLAIPDFKHDEPGLVEAARGAGLALLRISPAELRAQQPRCVTRSARVRSATGVDSVAEACALAATAPGGRLVLPRITAQGVTCAIAVADNGAP
ncbi:cobalamin biosynthesis protein [Lichenicoccus sp.]|uniref:cobalamin biosynthesis protein n=1 Tax=Lichenicoccus sp. TaxID=2781899 RepID=UPI003D0F752E